MNASSSPSTASGLRRGWDDFVDLIGSMRFAVSLLSFICIASVIGTVLQQGQPPSNYINQFGPFWYELFEMLQLYHVYNAWWFLLVMTFLVVSTSICVTRNGPKMFRDMRTFREHLRESSLKSFPHRAEFTIAGGVAQTVESLSALLRARGYKFRTREDGDAVLIAAKAGASNRLGYIFAHLSIVIICIGGLLDSELPVRAQIWVGSKLPVRENMTIADVPTTGRLSPSNPSFRANMMVSEGGASRNAIVLIGDGALVQPLPFTVALKKFVVEYYSTGMPRSFASEVSVTDPDTGKSFDQTIKVNEPLRFKGMTVYQSSFNDGGSTVELKGYPLRGGRQYNFDVKGKIGDSAQIDAGTEGTPPLNLEFSNLRPINVENFSGDVGNTSRGLGEHVASVAGSAARPIDKNLRNVGPSVEYRIRDASGQAREFHNYMLPMTLDGNSVFLAGMRATPDEAYRYLRIPADANGTMDEFMALRAALENPSMRAEAARRFAVANRPAGGDALSAQLESSSRRALDTFANGGLQAVAQFLQQNVASAEQQRAADVVIKLLGSSLAELRSVAREQIKLAPIAPGTDEGNWMQLSVAALSDLFLYPAPVLLSLADFQHVQASVFQVSRTPGKNSVYIGCLMLIMGVFAMFYIRERRVWIWVKPEDQGVHASMAMSSARRTLDFEREFARLRDDIGAHTQNSRG
jgi:cytochrome c biogenesis protein